jgi:hypothetical protein
MTPETGEKLKSIDKDSYMISPRNTLLIDSKYFESFSQAMIEIDTNKFSLLSI